MSDIDDLIHFGVKGMRWGVRKSDSSRPPLTGLGPDKIEVVTKNGDKLTLHKDKPTPIHKALAAVSENYRRSYAEGALLTIRDKDGKKVGDAHVWKKGDNELYLNWLGIKSSARGQGYATASVKAAEKFGAQQGFKKMTLEVPGDAPDARHIYEKLGFKVTRELSEDDIWGGLTEMEYRFKDTKRVARHSSLEDDYGWLLEGMVEYMDGLKDPLEHAIFHFGVKGMRWGFRKGSGGVTSTGRRKAPTSADFKKAEAARRKVGVKKTGPAAKKTAPLSNEELQALVKRMNLEKQYAELSTKDQQKVSGAQITGKILGGLGKGAGQVGGNIVKSQATRLGNELAAKQIEELLKRAGKK